MDRREQRGLHVEGGRLQRDRDRLLGQARAADPGARPEERRPDPAVQADALDDRLDVRAGRVGDAGQLVGERDLHPEEDVRSELDQGDRTGIRDQRRRAERRVQVDDRLGGRLVPRLQPAGHDAVRAIEVLEGLAFAHELGIGDDRRALGGSGGGRERREAARPVERERGADHDHVVRTRGPQQPRDRDLDVDRGERAIRTGRRAHADEAEAGVGGGIELGGEGQRAAGQGDGQRLGQARLEDGRSPVRQAGNPPGVVIGDGDPMAEAREADRGDQTDVARTEQEQVHG